MTAKTEIDIVKRPHSKSDYTENNLLELMQCVEDPLYFIQNFVLIQHPIKGAVPFEPFPYQVDMIKAFHENRFVIGLTGRQMGKCLTSDTAITKDGSKVKINSLVPTSMKQRVVDWIERLLIGSCSNRVAVSTIKGILWVLDADHRHNHEIGNDDVKKFTHIVEHGFRSDFGMVQRAFRTVPYEVWELITTSKKLLAADRHRVVREDHSCAWLEDLKPGDRIKTDVGVEEVVSCRSLGIRTHMYCVEVETDDPSDPMNHLFYTDGVLSHNTTCSSAYLLWRAMFTPDTTILITANKYVQALEIMDRIRYAYENLPDYIRAGVTEYNKGTVAFDNGSKIVSRATSADAGRGLSITLLYCLDGDTTVTVRDKMNGEVRDITLRELYEIGNEI